MRPLCLFVAFPISALRLPCPRRVTPLLMLGLLLLLSIGCDPQKYHRKTDEEVYPIIMKKQAEALQKTDGFTIDRPKETYRQKLIEESQKESGPAAEQGLETQAPAAAGPRQPARVLTLQEALNIAVENSREFQTERENVYLTALDLTLERHRFSNRFSAILSGGLSQEAKDNQSVDIGGNTTLSRALVQGGQLTTSLGLTALKVVTGGLDSEVISALDVQIVQPLLRGAGRKVALEGLVQAERDAIYAVQDFARFQKVFAVQIVSNYYNVLRQKQITENEYKNYRNLVASRTRAEALYQAGRLPEIQVGQTRQNELRARNRWVFAQQQYQSALDRFRVTLGLPTDASIELEPAELARLQAPTAEEKLPEVETAIRTALDLRLDHLIAQSRMQDAERKVEVALDGLKADLDFTFTAGVDSRRPNRFTELRFDNGRYAAGLDLGLPLDRKAERNIFREAEINWERSRRLVEQTEDQVKLQVREVVRQLAQAQESYAIQQSAVEEARRRVEATNLLLEAGRAQTRDLLEAQDALIDAQNGVTRAIVDHAIARLEFLRDTEQLDVDNQAIPRDL